jgi:hypothetical protein
MGAFLNTKQLHVDCSTRFFTNLQSATGYSRTSAPSPTGILTTWKLLADHYPERLAKAFIFLDALSMFYHVCKGEMVSLMYHPQFLLEQNKAPWDDFVSIFVFCFSRLCHLHSFIPQ